MSTNDSSSTRADQTQHVTATSTFSPSSATASCSPCERLLRQVLEQSQSRPHELLSSMMNNQEHETSTLQKEQNRKQHRPNNHEEHERQRPGLEWRTTPNGIQVKIPTEESLPVIPQSQRRWSRIQPPQHETKKIDTTMTNKNTSALPFAAAAAQLFQATSSSSSAALGGEQQPALLKTHGTRGTNNTDGPCSSSSCPTTKTNTAAETIPDATEWMNVSCEVCPWTGPKGNARAFVNGPRPLDIVICSNRLRYTEGKLALREMEEMITHELVHVYDARQMQLDLRDCENLAYSEVRAAREAECRSFAKKYEEAQAQMQRDQQHQQQQNPDGAKTSSYWPKLSSPSPSALLNSCVKERAFLATKNLFSYSDSRACLNKVFDAAMADKRPFAFHAEEQKQQECQNTGDRTKTETDHFASQR